MADQSTLHDLNKLGAQLDKLEAIIEPLLQNLPQLATQLPLLDRARLFTLLNYATGTTLFATVKLSNQDALQHPVYTEELKRVQQYLKKIEDAENPPGPRTAVVDKAAATRMIRAGLSDDALVKERLSEKLAKDEAKAFLESISKRGADGPADGQSEKASKKRKANKSGTTSSAGSKT